MHGIMILSFCSQHSKFGYEPKTTFDIRYIILHIYIYILISITL